MIRNITMEDADMVYILMKELMPEPLDHQTVTAILEKQLGQPELYTGFVCEEKQKGIVGIVNLRIEEQLHHGSKVAEVMELVVLESERGKGIGTRLLRKAEDYARKCGCVEMELSSHFVRKDAHIFYEHYGMNKDHYNFTKKIL